VVYSSLPTLSYAIGNHCHMTLGWHFSSQGGGPVWSQLCDLCCKQKQSESIIHHRIDQPRSKSLIDLSLHLWCNCQMLLCSYVPSAMPLSHTISSLSLLIFLLSHWWYACKEAKRTPPSLKLCSKSCHAHGGMPLTQLCVKIASCFTGFITLSFQDADARTRATLAHLNGGGSKVWTLKRGPCPRKFTSG